MSKDSRRPHGALPAPRGNMRSQRLTGIVRRPPDGRCFAPTQCRMDLEDRESLCVHLMRLPARFAPARGILRDELFTDPAEHHLKVLWMVMCDLVALRYRDGAIPHVALRKAVCDWYDDVDNATI